MSRLATGRPIYAIGDVHGRRDLLYALLAAIETDAAVLGEHPLVVFLGDVIDRGPESREAMDLVIDTLARYPGSRLILGNHEDFMLRFIDGRTGRARVARAWFANGGAATVASYGCGVEMEIDAVAAHIAGEFAGHVEALRNADWLLETESHVFVHAGIDPLVPLSAQDPEVSRWIRREFLDWPEPFEKTVVHGHTPTESLLPEIVRSRIAVDTGAVFSGHLTCAVIAGDSPPRFLATRENGAVAVSETRPLLL